MNMEILIDCVLYVIILAAFLLFGRFMRECDDATHQQITGVQQ